MPPYYVNSTAIFFQSIRQKILYFIHARLSLERKRGKTPFFMVEWASFLKNEKNRFKTTIIHQKIKFALEQERKKLVKGGKDEMRSFEKVMTGLWSSGLPGKIF